MKTFSIIIPVYNGDDVIGRALDSIYSQGMANDSFEVICVDDCSPTMETFETLNNYTYEGVHPTNLKILRHEVNKRQGGARNTALNYANGEWILYLDQDDCFVKDSLHLLHSNIAKYSECDILMFDCQIYFTPINKLNTSIYTRKSFKTEVLSGRDFIQKYPIPWSPWCYLYKKSFLLANNVRFVEGVRFEDVDYVINCTLLAHNMVFLPIEVYRHIHSGENTSFVGNDRKRIEDLFRISIRMKNVALNFGSVEKDAAVRAAMGHHIYQYHWMLERMAWRLSFEEILEMFHKYPPYDKSEDKLINFTRKHPRLYAALAQIARPFLLAAIWMKNKLK